MSGGAPTGRAGGRIALAIRCVVGAVALGLIGFGVRGLVGDPHVDTVWPILWWLVGTLVLHDAVLAPLLILGGLALSRALPARVREVVRGGLLIALVVSLVATPLMLRQGASENPTVLPLDYTRNWLLVLGAIAVVTTVLALATAWRRRDRGRTDVS
jgi:hypothetical protein